MTPKSVSNDEYLKSVKEFAKEFDAQAELNNKSNKGRIRRLKLLQQVYYILKQPNVEALLHY